MLMLLTAAGGIALLIFGVRFLLKGVGRLFGSRLQTVIGRMTDGTVRTVLAGIATGFAAPSTSAQSLLATSLVREGKLSARSAINLLLGAGIGATVLVHIVAFDVNDYAPILMFPGVLLFLGLRRDGLRGVGQVLIGLSLIFMAIGILKDVGTAFARSPEAPTLIEIIRSQLVMVALTSMVLTLLFQSTTATLGVLIAVASVNGTLLDGSVVLACIAGANLSPIVTGLIAGWAQWDTRRFMLAALICKTLAAVLVVGFAPWISEYVSGLIFDKARLVAYEHTAFNVLALVIALLLGTPVMALLARALPEPGGREPEGWYPALDPRWGEHPDVALAHAKREINLATRITLSMFRDSWSALERRDLSLLERVHTSDDTVDGLERAVKRFLTRDLADDLSSDQITQCMRYLRFVDDLETIADVIDRGLAGVIEKSLKRGVGFSEEGWVELDRFYKKSEGVLEMAAAAFDSMSVGAAKRLLKYKEALRDEEVVLRRRHFERLRSGSDRASETTGIHLELLSHLKHVAHIASGAAYGVLGDKGEPDSSR